MNILIVDDVEVVRNALKLILKSHPSADDIFECSDGSEVVPFLQNSGQQVDIILMDISMKVMDGLTATKLAKSHFPQTPIIILTMHDEEKYYTSAKEVGASAFLAKNTSSKQLFSVIDRVIKGETHFERS
jgi:DNA-binding NarL/FixJ family response regulator